MYKSLILTATALTLVAMSASAHAGTTVDKGELGKYERRGQFLKPVLTAAPRNVAADQKVAARDEAGNIVDKGELGKYERRGQFLKPVLEVGPQDWPNMGRVAPANSVTHKHGLNGKEHRNIGHKRAY